MDKTERQLNLIALLMESSRPLAASRIRRALYAEAPSDEAFKRMFERDKEDLRALGIRIEIDAIGAWEEGYVVRRDEATLPDLGLTPAEHAALMLAAEAWGRGTLGPASPRMAGMKISAATGEAPPAPWILPHVDLRSPNLATIFEAILRRKRIRFLYRPTGGPAAVREVEPHALRFRSAWYVSGSDVERGEPRTFKLDRIDGAVTLGKGKSADFEVTEPVEREWPSDAGSEVEALVAFEPETAWWAHRRPGTRTVGTREDGRVEVAVGVPDEDRFVSWVLGFGADAEVLAPDALRAATLERLRVLAGKGG